MAIDHSTGVNSEPLTGHPHRDWPYRRTAVRRYGVALLAVLVACLSRYVIYGDLNMRLAFTFFLPAVLVAVWYGGVGSGLLAMAAGLAAGLTFIFFARASFSLGSRELFAIAIYAVTAGLFVILCEHLHAVIRRLEHAFERERHSMSDATATVGNGRQPGSPFRRPAIARYGTALGVVALAFALRYWVIGTQDYRYPFLFFVPAVAIATWFGGMGPGMLAAVAGLMLGDYYFLSQHEAMGPVRESERLAIGLYAVTSTLCVMLIESLHVRIQRTEHAIEHAQHHHHKPHQNPASDSVYSH
jgi:Domain of unknown function (DUF4118)